MDDKKAMELIEENAQLRQLLHREQTSYTAACSENVRLQQRIEEMEKKGKRDLQKDVTELKLECNKLQTKNKEMLELITRLHKQCISQLPYIYGYFNYEWLGKVPVDHVWWQLGKDISSLLKGIEINDTTA